MIYLNFKLFFFIKIFSFDLKGNNSSVSLDSKLLPPPSPPAMLLSTNLIASDTGKMNAPLLRSPIFQSPPLQQHQNAKGNFKVARKKTIFFKALPLTFNIEIHMLLYSIEC